MKNPPHPGEIIKDLYIIPLKLTVTQAAEGLGVTRKTLSLILNGHAGISPEIAVRLSKAFGRSPESWLQLQMQYDLAQVKQKATQIQVTPFARDQERDYFRQKAKTPLTSPHPASPLPLLAGAAAYSHS